MRSTDVTVAVVVKDRRALMADCLVALFHQQSPAGEIVVVDNASRDGTYEDLQEHAAAGRIRLFRAAGSLGRIRNVAVREAVCPLVAFTDSDCRPRSDWLRHLVEPFADDAVAVVQGRTVPAGSTRDPFPVTQHIERYSGRFEACNIAYRRDRLLAAGGFDADIGSFGEDAAAGWRVLDAGGRAAFAGDAVVEHVVTYPGTRWWLRRSWSYRAWPHLVCRHPGIRRELLWHRLFLQSRSAAFDAAAIGTALAAGRRRWWPMLLTVPYLAMSVPRESSRLAWSCTARATLIDAARCAALVAGSIEAGTVVL